jgi:hypothetical protein
MTIKCDLCNKEFEYKAVLERHKNRKTPCIKKESYDCDICKSKFKFECDLKRHEKQINTLLILKIISVM